MTQDATTDWWRGAVIYQIYPRSYKDTSGNGIGDLKGITEKLGYIASLNVDAVWLSPFFTSPMKDYGYDISNYCDVDPMFGTLADFKTLLDQAHTLGLKVIIDQVYSHSSDQHPWFIESRQNKTNAKADWYVWADAKADGTPPNNWLSLFGGSAWQWDTRREQYYQHNFLTSQPDLNFHNPEVQSVILDTAAFWLELGVDGFRLDVVNMYFHDKALTDNAIATMPEQQFVGMDNKNPFCRQYHVHQMCREDNLEFLKRLRALLDQYPGSTTVGEIGAPDGMSYMAQYTSGSDKLHMAYTFELLSESSHPEFIRQTITRVENKLKDGWVSYALSNHDVVRSATRWAADASDQQAKVKAILTLLLCLRGSPCLYQGEELGLPEGDVPYDALLDPMGIEFWPEMKGRDGCRTPMAWENSTSLGFSTSNHSWLPADKSHAALSVAEQEKDSNSVLHYLRRFLDFRSKHPALIHGDFAWLQSDKNLLLFARKTEQEKLIIAINLTEQPLPLGEISVNETVWGSTDNRQKMAAFGFAIFCSNE